MPILPSALSELELESPPCLFCDSTEHRHYDSLDGWSLVKCTRCDFVFTSPRPIREALPKLYEMDYFDTSTPSNPAATSGFLETAPFARVHDIEKYVSKRGRVLEVGPAAGALLHALRQRGWDVSGVEISADIVELAREKYGLDLFCGELIDLPEVEPFDVICMYQSLEHVPDPRVVLQEAVRRLAPGGVLVVEVPNIASWDMKWNAERKRLSYSLPLHLNHFHHKFLKKAFQQLGLEVLEVDNYQAEFVLRWLHRRQAAQGHSAVVESSELTGPEGARDLPLLRPATGWKQQVLKLLGQIFPGWRVTAIGRKI